MLGSPLHQRINANFFTGGMSQHVATAMKTSDATPADANESGARHEADLPHHVAAPSAMQQSLAVAQQIVDSRGKPQSDHTETRVGGAGKKPAGISRSLAASQAAALQKAVAAKRARKAGRTKRSTGAVIAGRDAYGVDALAALKSSS
eukprot:TRINITY_DN16814_c0_g1_i2.p2 TRINITY_DN16814_c0_g1~~TRINITY_DN16814_c0_g1_i2.p2  ORF type:complete len:166 (+),score=27.92 TRINITY_DN16814_c0_g1_i2:57-500(+)